MRYELWELSAGNMVGAFESEAEALRAVADRPAGSAARSDPFTGARSHRILAHHGHPARASYYADLPVRPSTFNPSVAGVLVDHVVQRLAGLVAAQVIDQDVDAALAGERGRGAVVRRHYRVRQVPERAVG